MRNLKYSLLACLSLLSVISVKGQSLPVGSTALEDYYRRAQLLGQLDSTVSFTVRPIMPVAAFKVKEGFYPDSAESRHNLLNITTSKYDLDGKFKVMLLPISLQTQLNTHHPYGWNDGAMIPAKGSQTLISAGIYAEYGPLTIQLKPEFVAAANTSFDTFNEDHYEIIDARYYAFYNNIDLPVRFGNKSYNKLSWGQSSIRLNHKNLSLGLSNENLWWGPGMRNSLLMSNTAPGFKHITLNTIKPISTPLGSFEGQLIAGRLEGSGYGVLEPERTYFGEDLFVPKRDDWRYLSGIVLTWQPKWVPGLFLGLTRSAQLYGGDLNQLQDYLPFRGNKKQNAADEAVNKRDQRNSYFMRWLWPEEHAEIYFEFGRNNYSGNAQDLMLTSDESRAYIFGVRKLFPFGKRKDENLMINVEVAQMQETSLGKVEHAQGWYTNSNVRHGYTNRGEVLGAGIGPGGNSQSLEVSWVKGLKRLGLQFERQIHNNDFYFYAYQDSQDWRRHWTDLSIAAVGEWNYKNLIFNAKVQGINSLNYQWYLFQGPKDLYTVKGNDAFNFQVQAGLTYRF